MTVRALLWCLSGVCALVSMMALAATAVPEAEPHRYIVVGSGVVGTVVFGAAAVRAGFLSAEHALNQSLPGWVAWTVFAVVFMLVMASVG